MKCFDGLLHKGTLSFFLVINYHRNNNNISVVQNKYLYCFCTGLTIFITFNVEYVRLCDSRNINIFCIKPSIITFSSVFMYPNFFLSSFRFFFRVLSIMFIFCCLKVIISAPRPKKKSRLPQNLIVSYNLPLSK